jgi:hypothetical protein
MLSEKQTSHPFDERYYDNQHLIDRLREHNNHIDKKLIELKQSFKQVNNKRKALSNSQELKEYNDVTVTRLLAKRFSTAFNEENYQKCIRDIQIALLSLSGFMIITALAWLTISNTNFLTNSDFSYNAGLLGGFLMLCSIFYALLKRIRFINAMGHNETWFYAHLICGVLGTMIVLFHTTFQIKSINSGVALTCLLLVIVSGIFGRYVCTILLYQAHIIYEKIGLQEISLINALAKYRQTTSKNVKFGISRLLAIGLGKGKRWYEKVFNLVKLPYYTFSLYFNLRTSLNDSFSKIAIEKNLEDSELKEQLKDKRILARQYVKNISLLCLTQITSDILVHWRTIHSSILYLLTLTAVGHIVAVHMY